MTATDQVSIDFLDRLMGMQAEVNLERFRHLERELSRVEELVAAKMEAQAIAIVKSEDAYNARFASANEFRASLDDMTRNMVTREFVDTKLEGQTQRLTLVENRLANYDGRILGYSAGIGIVVLIISIASQLIGLGG